VNNVKMEEENERHTRSTLFMLAVCYIFHVLCYSCMRINTSRFLYPRDARRARGNARSCPCRSVISVTLFPRFAAKRNRKVIKAFNKPGTLRYPRRPGR